MNIIRIYRILASSLPTKDEILQNVCSLFPYNFASLQVEIGSLVDNLKAIPETEVPSILVSLFFGSFGRHQIRRRECHYCIVFTVVPVGAPAVCVHNVCTLWTPGRLENPRKYRVHVVQGRSPVYTK